MTDFTKGIVYTAVGSASWGISGVCSQYLFSHYELDSSWLTAVRMVASGLVLLALVAKTEKSRVFHVFCEKKDVFWLLLFAIFGLLFCQYTYLAAIDYSNSGTASVLQSLNVVLMAVVMAVWTRTRIGGRQLVAIILAIFGTTMIATNGQLTNMAISAKGLMFGLLSAVGVVSYSLLSQVIIEKWGNRMVTGWGMLLGGLVLTVLTQTWKSWPKLDAVGVCLVLIIVVVGTAGGFSLFIEGVRLIGPVRATLLGCLEPVSATVLAVLFLGTRFGFPELIGFAAILTTVFLSCYTKRAEQRQEAEQMH